MGYVFADPTSYIGDVIQTMLFDLNIHVSIDMEPRLDRRDAWDRVDRLVFSDPPDVAKHDAIELIDYRENRWELFKRPRVLPVMKGGSIKAVICMPWELSLPMAQARLTRRASWKRPQHVMAIDEDNWVVCERELDERLIYMVDGYMSQLQRDNERVYRGGMQVGDCASKKDSSLAQWAIVWVKCTDEKEMWQKYCLDSNIPLRILRDHLRSINPGCEVHMAAQEIWLNLGMPAKTYDGTRIYLHIEPKEKETDLNTFAMSTIPEEYESSGSSSLVYHEGYNIEEFHGIEELTCNEGNEVFEELKCVSESYEMRGLYTIEEYETLMFDYLMRGGMRNRQNVTDPRVAMHAWAFQRVSREFPSINAATLNILLRAEARTVTAVLNSRSTMQLASVIDAALRRAGLPPMQPTPQQQQENEQDQAQQQDADQQEPRTAPTTEQPAYMDLHLQQTLQQQVYLAQQILHTTMQQPTSQDFINLIATMQVQASAQARAVQQLAEVVAALESRMQMWETTFLREVIDRLPHGAPQTPDDTQATQLHEEAPMETETQQIGPLQTLQPEQGPQPDGGAERATPLSPSQPASETAHVETMTEHGDVSQPTS